MVSHFTWHSNCSKCKVETVTEFTDIYKTVHLYMFYFQKKAFLHVCDRSEPCFMSFLVSIAPLEWCICWSIGWCSIGISYREICIWSCGATQRWSKRGHGISHTDTVWSIQTKWWTSKWCGSKSRTQRTVSRSTSIFIYYCQDFLKNIL